MVGEAFSGRSQIAAYHADVMSTPTYTPPAVAAEHLEGDLVTPDDPRYQIIWINPARMSGTPCFYGTRVPVETLFDHLRTSTVEEFLDAFPPITREHVDAVLNLACDRLVREAA
jgi:uncharacterized protein (DUF433 family)